MIEINRNPSRRELLIFGLLFALFFAIVGSIAYWGFKAPRVAQVLWIGAAVVTVAFYLIPPMRRPLYLGWMYAAFPLGFVMSWVMMSAVFSLVFTPIGLAMRLFGRDPMTRRLEPDRATYWVAHRQAESSDRYFRQF